MIGFCRRVGIIYIDVDGKVYKVDVFISFRFKFSLPEVPAQDPEMFIDLVPETSVDPVSCKSRFYGAYNKDFVIGICK